MSVVPNHRFDSDRPIQWAFTVEQYHEMLAMGVLEEGAPYELLNGIVVHKLRNFPGDDPMTVNPDHSLVVELLGELKPQFRRVGCHVRIQQPIIIPPHSEPEPDATVVFGSPKDFANRHPRADDIACVIEVSAASLRRDRTEKLALYASAGIARYLILNLLDRVAELYTEPKKSSYTKRTIFTPQQYVEVPTSKKPIKLQVKQLMP